MDLIDVKGIVAIVGLLIGGLAWLFNLQSRVNAHEAGCTQRQKNLDERHAHIEGTLAVIVAKLDRIVEGRT